MDPSRIEAILGISSALPSSALSFLQPDVLLHVYDLWSKNLHQNPTSRTFSVILNNGELRPFIAFGMQDALDFVVDWRISPSDIAFLQTVPSFDHLSKDFWSYLLSIERFSGAIQAVPEGTIFGTSPMKMSDEIRKNFEYTDVSPFPLLRMEGEYGQVSLLSEYIYNIIASASYRSKIALAQRGRGPGRAYYGLAEAMVHPLDAYQESASNFIAGNTPSIFAQNENISIICKDINNPKDDHRRSLMQQIRRLHGLDTLFVIPSTGD